MGDASLPIDRYDGRGALANLTEFESPVGGSGDVRELMSAEERHLHEQCEEERYLSLSEAENDFDRATRDEEEKKRVSASGGQFAYNYQEQQQLQQQEEQQQQQPSLRTLANCIEKTAEFIVTQGAQMEILVKQFILSSF